MESIFSALKSYVPSMGRDPQEDYLTQLFAWLLAHTPGLGVKFCQYLLTELPSPAFSVTDADNVLVDTQVAVAGGRIDMLLKIGSHGFVCEHKVMSGLGDQQVARYANSFNAHTGTFYTVLITATTLQHTQPADIRLVWADVYDFLLRECEHCDDPEYRFLLDHALIFFRQQGLGHIEPITMENLLGFFPGNELICKLEGLLPKLVNREWAAACPGLQALNILPRYAPEFHKSRWGRIGIDFFKQDPEWQPGVFAGVLLNGYDHALSFVDERLGPDLVVLLEYDYYPKASSPGNAQAMTNRARYLSHPNYQELCTRLMVDSATFRFQGEVRRNPWRILVLQQPLVQVLQAAETEREQLDRIFEACCKGINLFTQDGLLAQIPR